MTSKSLITRAIVSIIPQLSAAQQQVLVALYKQPGHAATSAELAKHLDWDKTVLVNNAMSNIGVKLYAAHLLPSTLDHPHSWFFFANGHRTSNGFLWTLRQDAALGLVEAGIVIC